MEVGIGQFAGSFQQGHRPVGHVDVVLHRRHGGDQVEAELPLQTFSYDLHVEQAEKAAAEAEAQRGGGLWFVLQTCVIELQLFQRVPEALVLFRVGGIDAGKHHRLDFAIAGQELGGAFVGVENGVTGTGVGDAPQVGDDVADLTRLQHVRPPLTELEIADLVHDVDVFGMGPECDLHSGTDGPIHHADAGHRTTIAVEVGIEDERPKRRFLATPRSRAPA